MLKLGERRCLGLALLQLLDLQLELIGGLAQLLRPSAELLSAQHRELGLQRLDELLALGQLPALLDEPLPEAGNERLQPRHILGQMIGAGSQEHGGSLPAPPPTAM